MTKKVHSQAQRVCQNVLGAVFPFWPSLASPATLPPGGREDAWAAYVPPPPSPARNEGGVSGNTSGAHYDLIGTFYFSCWLHTTKDQQWDGNFASPGMDMAKKKLIEGEIWIFTPLRNKDLRNFPGTERETGANAGIDEGEAGGARRGHTHAEGIAQETWTRWVGLLIGSLIIVEGQTRTGKNSRASEIGHVVIRTARRAAGRNLVFPIQGRGGGTVAHVCIYRTLDLVCRHVPPTVERLFPSVHHVL